VTTDLPADLDRRYRPGGRTYHIVRRTFVFHGTTPSHCRALCGIWAPWHQWYGSHVYPNEYAELQRLPLCLRCQQALYKEERP
jgi:hypothetical protein